MSCVTLRLDSPLLYSLRVNALTTVSGSPNLLVSFMLSPVLYPPDADAFLLCCATEPEGFVLRPEP